MWALRVTFFATCVLLVFATSARKCYGGNAEKNPTEKLGCITGQWTCLHIVWVDKQNQKHIHRDCLKAGKSCDAEKADSRAENADWTLVGFTCCDSDYCNDKAEAESVDNPDTTTIAAPDPQKDKEGSTPKSGTGDNKTGGGAASPASPKPSGGGSGGSGNVPGQPSGQPSPPPQSAPKTNPPSQANDTDVATVPHGESSSHQL